MRMEIYSAHIMGGLLMGVDLVLGFLRLHQKVLKLVLWNHLKHVLLGFLPWCLRVCFLFGLMRMVGKKPKWLSPHREWFNSLLVEWSKYELICLSSLNYYVCLEFGQFGMLLRVFFMFDNDYLIHPHGVVVFYLACLMTLENPSLPPLTFNVICSMAMTLSWRMSLTLLTLILLITRYEQFLWTFIFLIIRYFFAHRVACRTFWA